MGETRKCFALISMLLKLLGSYPVLENDSRIVFRWYSFRTFCSLFSVLVALVCLGFNIQDYYDFGFSIIVLDLSGMAMQLSFLLMAKHWPELGRECDKIDFCMGSYCFPKRNKLNVQVISLIFVVIDFTLHWSFEFFTPSGMCSVLAKSFGKFTSDPSFLNALNFLAIFVRKISHFQIGMLRTLMDIYIITVSMVLATRLGQVAERVGLLIERKIQNEEAWMQTREDYQRICVFIEKWDKLLGYFVLLSFVSNIYLWHLHFQVLLSPSGAEFQYIVTALACSYTLLRCLVVCYIAGNVHAEGTRLIEFIVLTPPEVYNAEVDRIIVQLRQARPALTGKQLFTLKHSLIVQVLGGIATHEIILLQYNARTK